MLLIRLMEEAGEVVQAASKAIRFGLDSHGTYSEISNFEAICAEAVDVQLLVEELKRRQDLRWHRERKPPSETLARH